MWGMVKGRGKLRPKLGRPAITSLFLPFSSTTIDVSYAAPLVHGIANVALHQEYSSDIVFIFSQGRKDLNHV
jgi:hypothetical protein